MKAFFFCIFFILLIIPLSFAHEDEIAGEEQEKTLPHQIQDNSMKNALAGAGFLALITLYILTTNKQKFFKKQKTILFILIVLTALLVTFYLIYSTLYLNAVSQTRGPVHWHADYEIYLCGEKVELINPEGLSNKIGSSIFHEHNDNRIHIEGVVVNPQEVSLKEFFEVTGGQLSATTLTISTPQSVRSVNNGELCNNQLAILQAFLYKTVNGKVQQEKLLDFPNYVISPQSYVPPGDCIIIEFSQESPQTDKLCQTYETALQKGELVVDAGVDKNSQGVLYGS